jgi:hypothetical protein
MLSGDSISLYALEHARELLKKDWNNQSFLSTSLFIA